MSKAKGVWGMELLQLRYFRAIARNENISKTARELSVAQPSLSATLKHLEDEVGCQLFDRKGRRIILNDAGRVMLRCADEIFDSLANARSDLDILNGIESKTVSISFRVASHVLPDAVKAIKAENPDIHLLLTQGDRLGSEGDAPDLAIFSLDHERNLPGTALLAKEPIGLALPSTSPLASKQKVTLADLSNESFIELDSESDLSKVINRHKEISQFNPDVIMSVNSPSVMRGLLRIGLGCAFVPKHTWGIFESPGLTFRMVDDLPMERYIYVSWDAGRRQSESIVKAKDALLRFFCQYDRP